MQGAGLWPVGMAGGASEILLITPADRAYQRDLREFIKTPIPVSVKSLRLIELGYSNAYIRNVCRGMLFLWI